MPHMAAMMLIGGLVVLGVLVGLGLVLWSSLRDRYVGARRGFLLRGGAGSA